MAEIKKIGDEYFVEYYAQGLLFRKKGGKTLPEAQGVLRQIEESLPDPHRWYQVREDEIDSIFQKFFEVIQKDYSDVTLQRFKNVIEDFQKFLSLIFPDYHLISHITPHVVSRYSQYLIETLKSVRERSMARRVNFSLLLLSEIFIQAIAWGALNDNPVLHVKAFRRDLLSRPRGLIKGVIFDRNQQIRQLIEKGVSLIKIMKSTGIKDIGRLSYFAGSVFENFEKKIM